MKFFSFALIMLTISASAFAEKEEMLEKGKAMMVSNIDKRITVLQQTKSCISAATSRDKLKECGKKMREQMREVKEDALDDRKEMKAKFKEMKEKKKDKKSS